MLFRSGSQHDSGGTTRIKVGRRATDVREDFLIADNPRAIPHMVFPDEVFFFVIDSIGREKWSSLSEDTKRFVATLGCKLEPIVQIVPATPVPLVLGFECLGLGSLGENFVEICRKCNDLDAGLIRICLAVVAIKTISSLRIESMRSGLPGARNLVFSINLDPFMIESPHFKKFLKWYFHDLAHNVMFEVNETTTKQYLSRLKNLQVDYNLRYSADDLNEWHDEVRIALLSRVEMTKMDYRSFADAMAIRGEDKEEALARLYAHNLPNRPLVVEGVQDSDYLEFLERHWNFAEHGYLYGQGYILESGVHWDNSVRPLKGYGLPGGSFLLSLS